MSDHHSQFETPTNRCQEFPIRDTHFFPLRERLNINTGHPPFVAPTCRPQQFGNQFKTPTFRGRRLNVRHQQIGDRYSGGISNLKYEFVIGGCPELASRIGDQVKRDL